MLNGSLKRETRSTVKTNKKQLDLGCGKIKLRHKTYTPFLTTALRGAFLSRSQTPLQTPTSTEAIEVSELETTSFVV